jgi:hypothetical protein
MNILAQLTSWSAERRPARRGRSPRAGRLRFESLEIRQLLAVTAGDFDGDGFEDLAIGYPGEDVGGVFDAGAVNVIYGSANKLTSGANRYINQDIVGVQGAAEAGDRFGAALVTGDFNGDGYDDLAVGVPGEDVGAVRSAGAVNVFYGSAGFGLTSDGDDLWHQDASGVLDAAEGGDAFGESLAVGDFNGDGYDDLAIGVPGENVGGVVDAGAVSVLPGGVGGLTSAGDQFWHQDKAGVLDSAESDDRFGSSLAAGDFNGDGRDDLAIGVPDEDVDGRYDWRGGPCQDRFGIYCPDGWPDSVVWSDAGAVNVLRGSATMLTATGDQFLQQHRLSSIDDFLEGNAYGFALAAGDFENDGMDDLAIGVPGEQVGDAGSAGVVYVKSGSADMLQDGQFWNQDRTGVLGEADSHDNFGAALATGDFDGDGYDELVIGAPGEDVGTAYNAGGVNVLYGSAAGLTGSGDQLFKQSNPGLLDQSEDDDVFGAALVAGDFNGDGFDDLAVNAPGEDLGAVTDAGAVDVLFGTATGLLVTGNQFWHQDISGILDAAEDGDGYSSS